VAGDLIRVGKARSAGWLAGSGRLVIVRRSSLLAWAGGLATAAVVVAAAVPACSRGHGWPAASAPTRATGPLRRRRGLHVLVVGCLGRGCWPLVDLQLSAAPSASGGSWDWVSDLEALRLDSSLRLSFRPVMCAGAAGSVCWGVW
jgi:hypothetical protein